MVNDHLVKFQFTFSVDRNFLINQAFDQILFQAFDRILFQVVGQVRLGKVRSGQVMLGQVRPGQVREKIIRSSEKSQKFWSTHYENFDQLIKHNFDLLNFGQTIPCLLNLFKQTYPLFSSEVVKIGLIPTHLLSFKAL